MAKAESRSITRRSLVAGSAAGTVALAAGLPSEAAVARLEQGESRDRGESGPGFRYAQPGLQDKDPIHAAIEAHARAYAACEAYQEAEPEDEVGLEPLLDAERAAADALAATVPATLGGVAAALSHVHALHARDDSPMLDDYHCYVLIGSAATALRCALARTEA